MEDTQQTGAADNRDTVVTQDQARLVADQFLDHPSVPQGVDTSTGAMANQQTLILMELQKISQRFGKLEEQTNQDRAVLSGLVTQMKQQKQSTAPPNLHSSSLFSSSTVNAPASTHSDPSSQDRGVVTATNMVGTTFTSSSTVIMYASAISHKDSLSQPNAASMSTNVLIMTPSSGNVTSYVHHVQSNQGSASVATSYGAPWGTNHTTTNNSLNIQAGVPGGLIGNELVNKNNNSQHSANNVTHTHVNNSPMFCSTAIQGQDQTSGTQIRAGTQQGSQGMAEGDNLIPSLQTLRQTGDITQKVQQRYQELEQAATLDSAGNLQLLLEVLNKRQKQDKNKVKWPQDLAFVGSMRKRPTYDQLTMAQWLLGFMRIRQEEQNAMVREHMADYVTELLQDACDYSWESAKRAHSVLLHRMQDGVVDWINIDEVHKIRRRYAQTTAIQNHSERNKSLKVVP